MELFVQSMMPSLGAFSMALLKNNVFAIVLINSAGFWRGSPALKMP